MELGLEVGSKRYSRFLRYPGPEQGLGYRAMRVGVIVVLRAGKLLGR